MEDLHFGVHTDMMYALAKPPIPGAQWTGVVTQIAIQMLESGQVDAVVCVQSDEHDRFSPKPVRCIGLLPCSEAQQPAGRQSGFCRIRSDESEKIDFFTN